MIQFTKGIMYQWKISQGDQKRRTLSDNNPTMDRAIHNGADMSIGTQSEKERMQRHRIQETPE